MDKVYRGFIATATNFVNLIGTYLEQTESSDDSRAVSESYTDLGCAHAFEKQDCQESGGFRKLHRSMLPMHLKEEIAGDRRLA